MELLKNRTTPLITAAWEKINENSANYGMQPLTNVLANKVYNHLKDAMTDKKALTNWCRHIIIKLIWQKEPFKPLKIILKQA